MSFQHGLTPRMKPLSSRKSTTLSVLDIGTSKIVCLVAQLQPIETLETLRGRTHLARVLGIGHQRSLGMKGGVVVDLEAAEGAIRQAIHAAERMAKVEIQSVIVNLTGGRLGIARRMSACADLRARPTCTACSRRQARTGCAPAGRCCMRCRRASRSTRRPTSSIPRA
jgi:hypothetical protein